MSERRFRPVLDHSSQEESLPDEWTSVQKRLDYLESAIVKLTKRSQKLQKRMQQQSEDLQATRKDTRALIQQVLQEHSNQLSVKQKELQFENMRAQIDDLHGFIKRIQKKNNEMLKEIKSSTIGGALSDSRIEDKIEERVERMMQKHQAETTRAIAELRRMLTNYNKDHIYDLRQQKHQYVRESTPIERKSSQKILSNSRSKVNFQRSAQKSYRVSQTEAAYQQPSIDHHLKSRNPQVYTQNNTSHNVPVQNNASSRVELLREKLKQFEQTNKKFEQKLQKRPSEGTPKGKTVQKLKDFKNYLQQSESELDQSNLDNKEHNVLTDSIKNWKKGDRFRQ